jgi:hypothetical protein
MNARQHTIDHLVWTLCGAAQDVKIAMILLHYWCVKRRAELFVRDSRSPLNVASGENRASQCLLVSHRQVLTTRGRGCWLLGVRVSDFAEYWNERQECWQRVASVNLGRKRSPNKFLFACIIWYFGLQHLFLFAHLNLFGEPHSFYTSQGHQYLWSQMGHFRQLNTWLPDCHICSTVLARQVDINAHTHTAGLQSCVLSLGPAFKELGVADSLRSRIRPGWGRNVFSLDMDK